jgi:hypothetical protein
VIRGPRRAEHVAQLLIEHKPEVLAALAPHVTLLPRGEPAGLADPRLAMRTSSTSCSKLGTWREGEKRGRI